MNKRYAIKFGVLSLALLAMATFAPPASASVIGHLVVGIYSGGDVVVGQNTIIWAPATADPTKALIAVGGGTNLSSVGDGSLTGSTNGITATINDLTLSPSSGAAGFMSFTGPGGVNLVFNLAPTAGLGPGVATDCIPDPAVGYSCSPGGSPFILMRTNTGTAVTLLAHGTITDSDGSLSIWNGQFSTQINGSTPADIEAVIAGKGYISSSFAGEFDVVAVPEPISMTLIGGGLIALVAMRRRKRA